MGLCCSKVRRLSSRSLMIDCLEDVGLLSEERHADRDELKKN